MKAVWTIGLMWLAAITLIVGISMWVGQRLRAPEFPSLVETVDADNPLMRGREIRFRVTENGNPEWEFSADTVVQDQQGVTTLTGLNRGIYYRDDGKPFLTAKAGTATYNQITKSVVMTGGVEVKGHDGLHFAAPSMEWDYHRKTIQASGPIQFRTDSGWVIGRSLVADLLHESFTLERVSGGFNLEAIETKDRIQRHPPP